MLAYSFRSAAFFTDTRRIRFWRLLVGFLLERISWSVLSFTACFDFFEERPTERWPRDFDGASQVFTAGFTAFFTGLNDPDGVVRARALALEVLCCEIDEVSIRACVRVDMESE